MTKQTYLNLLIKSLENKYNNENRTGVHVSDLVLCPRKAVFRKVDPQPLKMEELGYYTSGRAIHEAIQTLAQHYNDENFRSALENAKFGEKCVIPKGRFEEEKLVEWNGIEGHIDLFDSENRVPIECKSTRLKDIKEPNKHHVKQLKAYMAFLGLHKGSILYQLLLNSDGKPFEEFEIEMEDEEAKELLQTLLLDKELYLEALEKKDPMIARGVVNDKDLSWLCRNCPHLKECCDFENKVKV
jgi:CRISPR/Cas system-associated exonuclease Cas4 (RecB family)